MRNKLKYFIFLLFFLGCSKERVTSPDLVEILVGEWLLTETVDLATNGDSEWHEYPFPEFGITVFQQDSVITEYMTFAEKRGTYSVLNDTIFFSIRWEFGWTVTDFDEKKIYRHNRKRP